MSKICKIHGELRLDQIKREKSKYKLKDGTIKTSYHLKCLQCSRDKDRRYKLNNPEKHRSSASRARNEARRLYREGLSFDIPKANIWARNDREKKPEKYKEHSRRIREKQGQLRNTREICRRLEIDISYYYEMLKEQNGVCKICKQEETRKSRTNGKICALAIDHCHRQGIIRGLLCHSCNTGIGKFKDNIDLLKAAIQYLDKYKDIE